jgi:hypothetical protein
MIDSRLTKTMTNDRPDLSSERAPDWQNRNCQTVCNLWSWAPEGARHQDALTDWLLVVTELRRWLAKTVHWHPTQRSKEDPPQDKESQRAAYRQHGPDRLRSTTQLLPVYTLSAPARLSWLPQRQPTSSTAVFISPRDDPFQGQCGCVHVWCYTTNISLTFYSITFLNNIRIFQILQLWFYSVSNE